MKALFIWMGIGAAWQLGIWVWGRWYHGRFATDAASGIFLSRNPVRLVLQILVACAVWPIGMALFALPHRWVRRLWPDVVEQTREILRGRCRDCGQPIDEEGNHIAEPPPL
jgi:hypothetical protein